MSELAFQLIEENKRSKSKFLDLGNCALTNLPNDLSECTWIEELNLSSNYLNKNGYNLSKNKDNSNNLENCRIDVFDKLQELKALRLNQTRLSDISFLEKLVNLQSLDLGSNRVSDFSFLKKLVNLQSLNLGSSQISDFSFLGKLINLQSLDLSDNQISDFNFLEKLVNLQSLHLICSQISNISFLENLVNAQFLDLRNNQISDISFLKKLVNLKSLDLGSNNIRDIKFLKNLVNLQSLNLNSNQISDISFLGNLVNLQALDLNSNQISDISFLGNLVNLQSLYLESNQISDISFLGNLVNLQSLNLYSNQISDISFLGNLVNMQSLYLESNQISDFNDDLLPSLSNLNSIHLRGNPIQNVPQEIFGERNCLDSIRNYFKDKNKGTTPLYEAKIILVGNGRVGKTCLVKRLLDNSFNPNEISTHAIQLREWQLPELANDTGLEKIQINIWDFGGQDIYHATHRLFMKTKALFILVWDNKTERTTEQKEVLNSGKTIIYKNHSLHYWLSYIKTLSSNSPVIAVQSKMGIDGKIKPPISDEEAVEYNVYKTHSIESSESKSINNGFKALQVSIEEIITEQVKKSCTEIPTQWYNVRKKISGLQHENKKQAPLSQFEEICKEEGLDGRSAQTLLKYLHNTGVFFYQQGLFDNQIVIDQKWAIEAVYTLFDRTGYFRRLPDKGQFTGEDLVEVWNNYGLKEQELFVSFMKQCEICFELDEHDLISENIPFQKRVFIAPQLLPDEKPDSADAIFNEDEGVYFKYQHRFLHAVVIQRFIVRTGFFADMKNMWKNGIWIKVDGSTALIEAFPGRHELLVRIKGLQYKALLDKIRNELKEINQEEKEIKESVSLDGKRFILLEDLRNHRIQHEEIQAEDGAWVRFTDYSIFLKQDERAKFEKPKETHSMAQIENTRTKIYFSYAWGEERETFVDRLYSSLEQDGYALVRDRVDLSYKGLISEFMENIGKGNFVVVAISDKYIRSEYCMYELYELYRNAKLEKGELLKRIYPVRVENLDLNNPAVRREYYEYWKNLELKTKELVNEYGEDQSKHRRVEAIKNSLRDLLLFLNDINTLTKEELSANNFSLIKMAIQERVKAVEKTF